MKTTLCTLLAAAALVSGSASYGSGSTSAKATAVVELDNPADFTDFKISSYTTEKDTQALSIELRREINRLAANILPEGYRVTIRISDIDMAGDFERFRRPPLDDVRIVRSTYAPRMKLAYSVTDAAGNVVSSGERNLIDMSFDMRLRMPHPDVEHLQIETEMVGDFLRDIARSAS
jgi:hypothetical protein